jgi:MFS family permease
VNTATIPTDERKVQRKQLGVLAISLVLAMSTWFSTAAVLGQLRVDWSLSRAQASWLTIAVQLGFVIGAALSAIAGLADRYSPQLLIFVGAVGAAVANATLVFSHSFATAFPARIVTGAFLASVYPPSVKAVSGWFREGRGVALGVMIGALSIGSGLPHLLNSLGGVNWHITIITASVLTVIGGGLARQFSADGPYRQPNAPVEFGHIVAIISNRKFRLAALGYLGHMWELYAMWAWIAAFYGDVFTSKRIASLCAFVVIASGAAGSIYAGKVSDRTTRASAAGQAMRASAALALFTGFLIGAPKLVVLGAGVLWGFWVVADSAQFSAIVTEVVDKRHVGTALTLQLALGFVLSIFTIFLVPLVRDAHGWGWAFAMLAPGPLIGALAMRLLDKRTFLPTQTVDNARS